MINSDKSAKLFEQIGNPGLDPRTRLEAIRSIGRLWQEAKHKARPARRTGLSGDLGEMGTGESGSSEFELLDKMSEFARRENEPVELRSEVATEIMRADPKSGLQLCAYIMQRAVIRKKRFPR